MNIRILIVAIATAISLPVVAHAQSDASGTTRAQVRQEIVQLERVGYQPARLDNANYPDDILAAEARIRAAGGANSYAVNAVGGATDGHSDSGIRLVASGSQSQLFSHH
ncbi:DUF4148 domain-containing protein [Paraburkholderia dinghuensis]|uniref:DUF4148 domain-containing protein n=1 Tax=Paraburkholderia dinghuensis TaxID=2305225 RepID=A0A3N6MCM6_9BURK|nr:DUF4148 domain-containing protein [Paraburkholderia dinghuensis]RQH01664.1 DUF4148 domain-containing protein [Paraburkholderia dinghuensis]